MAGNNAFLCAPFWCETTLRSGVSTECFPTGQVFEGQSAIAVHASGPSPHC